MRGASFSLMPRASNLQIASYIFTHGLNTQHYDHFGLHEKVNVAVITSSHGPMPGAIRAMRSALVPLDTGSPAYHYSEHFLFRSTSF